MVPELLKAELVDNQKVIMIHSQNNATRKTTEQSAQSKRSSGKRSNHTKLKGRCYYINELECICYFGRLNPREHLSRKTPVSFSDPGALISPEYLKTYRGSRPTVDHG
jgi:hypothetical protein